MNKNIIASIIVALGCFLVFLLVIPEYQNIGAIREAIDARQALIQKRTDAVNKVKTLDQQYQTRQADVQKMLVFLPPTKQSDQLISGIQDAGAQNGIQIVDIAISSGSDTNSEAYKTTGITLSARGSYASMINFLKSLEQNLRIFDIQELTIAKGTNDQTLDISIKLNTYNLK